MENRRESIEISEIEIFNMDDNSGIEDITIDDIIAIRSNKRVQNLGRDGFDRSLEEGKKILSKNLRKNEFNKIKPEIQEEMKNLVSNEDNLSEKLSKILQGNEKDSWPWDPDSVIENFPSLFSETFDMGLLLQPNKITQDSNEIIKFWEEIETKLLVQGTDLTEIRDRALRNTLERKIEDNFTEEEIVRLVIETQERNNLINNEIPNRVKTIREISPDIREENLLKILSFTLSVENWGGGLSDSKTFLEDVTIALETNTPLDVLTIVCLRWNIINGCVEVLPDMKRHVVETAKESVIIESEEKNARIMLFLSKLAEIHQIPLNHNLCVSDIDLELTEHMSKENPAFRNSKKFTDSLRDFVNKELGNNEFVNTKVELLSEFLEERDIGFEEKFGNFLNMFLRILHTHASLINNKTGFSQRDFERLVSDWKGKRRKLGLKIIKDAREVDKRALSPLARDITLIRELSDNKKSEIKVLFFPTKGHFFPQNFRHALRETVKPVVVGIPEHIREKQAIKKEEDN